MKTDDDAFVRIDEVISSLKKSKSDGLLYGLISFQSSPHRDKKSKWFISQKVLPASVILNHDFFYSAFLTSEKHRNGLSKYIHHGLMVQDT
jgi:hypothetical protein